jgi:hypothetical protein
MLFAARTDYRRSIGNPVLIVLHREHSNPGPAGHLLLEKPLP